MRACRQIPDCLRGNLGVPGAAACPGDCAATVCDAAEPELPCRLGTRPSVSLLAHSGLPGVTFSLHIFSGIFLNHIVYGEGLFSDAVFT